MAFGAVLEDLAANMPPFAVTSLVAGLFLSFLFLVGLASRRRNQRKAGLRILPAVPGLPIVGNLLQLREKKPYKAFVKWTETYGPIYSIRTGAHTVVVVNSAAIAKEAMVTRFSSISTRKLSKALQILTFDKTMVALSDFDDFHKMVKRYLLASVVGAKALRRDQSRSHRDTMVENVYRQLLDKVTSSPGGAVSFRSVFEIELFGLAMKQAVGDDVKSIYVEETGTAFSKQDIFKALVTDFMEGAVAVDWRDFFPYLTWVPNKSWEDKIRQVAFRRKVLMSAIIGKQKKRMASGEVVDCYIDYLLTEATTLTEDQIAVLVWEAIVAVADTTVVTSEWALYELAKDPKRQGRLYEEIKHVCGSERVTEEHLPRLPYLGAVFHETLRKHTPTPIIPLRYAHEDNELGGYFVPKGSQIALNIYGCNMDKNLWEDPGEWIPERFLDDKYEPTELYKTMSFGAGKRVCAGSLQAMLIACVVIGRMVQEFEWKLQEGEEENVDTAVFTSHKLQPMQALLKPRR